MVASVSNCPDSPSWKMWERCVPFMQQTGKHVCLCVCARSESRHTSRFSSFKSFKQTVCANRVCEMLIYHDIPQFLACYWVTLKFCHDQMATGKLGVPGGTVPTGHQMPTRRILLYRRKTTVDKASSLWL